MRRAAKIDLNQRQIVEALRKAGCGVYAIGKPLDLLVATGRKTMLMEVKGKSGRYTDAQLDFIATWPGDWARVETPEQALTAMGILWAG